MLKNVQYKRELSEAINLLNFIKENENNFMKNELRLEMLDKTIKHNIVWFEFSENVAKDLEKLGYIEILNTLKIGDIKTYEIKILKFDL